MANIYTNRNNNSGSHISMNPNNVSTWSGGILPTSSDIAYIVGNRTTINMSSFSKWVGTKTITVASTTNFASSGFFYTQTNTGQIIKINYTSITSTTFINCTVDESDDFYIWDGISLIFNGAYVHNPAYIVTINSGETWNASEIVIQEGGWLFVNGGTLNVSVGITVRDGRLIGRGNGNIIISRNSNSLNGSNIGFITGDAYYMSIIDIDGGEVRTNATLINDVEVNDSSITISSVNNGEFKVGDEVAIYNINDYRRKFYKGYREYTNYHKNKDEGFDIVGVSGNTIYLGLRNGTTGIIKSVTGNDNLKIIEVKPDNTYFNKGDYIIIDNKSYYIDNIEDSEYLEYNYDFTNSNTSLSDFWNNDPTHIYSSGWYITQGVGLKNNSSSYKELINKYYWNRDVVVEAEISPLSNYINGTRGTNKFSILTGYDPSFRWGHAGDSSTKSNYFQVYDASDYISSYIRSVSNYNINRLSRDVSLLNETRNPATYKVDIRKGKMSTYVNNVEFSVDFMRNGNFKGLVGIHTSDANVVFKSLKISSVTQKLYITTTDNINVGSKVYLTGIQNTHYTGDKIVKISSINTGNGSHKDLAFAYRGQNGNGEFPLIIQVNGVNSVNSTLPLIHNHDMNVDYYYDLGNFQTAKSITIDLLSQKTFTHVSFVPRINDYSTYYGFNGVAIYGSNDLITWNTLYAPTNDTKYWYYQSFSKMGYYPTGTVSYRYVKFETKGSQVSPYTNRYVNIGVHDFSEGYSIELNNASDFNIGDSISVFSNSGYNISSREIEAYYAMTQSTPVNPENFYQGGWLLECNIINKINNKIFLNRPIFWGYIEDGDSVTVVKTNRNFLISGTMGNTNSTNDWRWPNINLNAGSNYTRKYLFKNIRFNYIGSYRYGGSSSYNRGIINRNYDYFNMTLLDGTVHMMGPDGTTLSGIGSYSGHMLMRNALVFGMYTGFYSYYPSSFVGSAVLNSKMMSNLYSINFLNDKNFIINYNEFTTTDSAINIQTLRTERFIVPHFSEVNRNYIKGTSSYAFQLGAESVGSGRNPKILFNDNKVRAIDDYVSASNVFTAFSLNNLNALSEHTGSRLSRYRNEGFMSQGDTSTDLSYTNMISNYGKYGYDLIFGIYYAFEKNYNNPNIIRLYPFSPDSYYTMLGLEIELYDNIPIEVYVQFDYRVSRINRIQDDGTDDGRLKCYSIQNGEIIETKYGIIPSSKLDNTWTTFAYKFTNFSNEMGKIAIYLNRSALNGYIEFKNSTAYVLCDNPDNIRIIGNSFNLNRIFDQYQEIKDIKPLTNNNEVTTKLTKIKFN